MLTFALLSLKLLFFYILQRIYIPFTLHITIIVNNNNYYYSIP